MKEYRKQHMKDHLEQLRLIENEYIGNLKLTLYNREFRARVGSQKKVGFT